MSDFIPYGIDQTTGQGRVAGTGDVTRLQNLLLDQNHLPITEGGTNSRTASAARTALGCAASGSNSDITALTGLTNPLVSVLGSVTGIDAKVAASTTLYTVPASKKAVITGVIIRLTAAASLITVATANVGVSSGDIIPSAIFTGLTSTNSCFLLAPTFLTRVGQATETVKLNITTGYVGTTATWSAEVLGYLI